MKIAVCDNEIEQANMIREALERSYVECVIETFIDMDELFEKVEKSSESYDAIFMDMSWDDEDKDGVVYSNQLYKINPKLRIVSISAYTMEYIEKMFCNRTNIYGVINKPIDINVLNELLNKLELDIANSKHNLVIEDGSKVFSENTTNIIYICSNGRCSDITTISGVTTIRKGFKKICDDLPDDFYVINKGICINMRYLKRIEENDVVLENIYSDTTSEYIKTFRLPIGTKKKRDLKDRFFAYVENNM